MMEILYIAIALAAGLTIGILAGRSQKSAAETKAQLLEKQLADAKAEAERRVVTLKEEHQTAVNKLEELHRQQMQDLNQQHKENLQQQTQLLREQLKTSAEQVLKERSEELSAINREQLSRILNPLQTGLKQMQEEVEKNRKDHNEGMATLKTAISQSVQQAEKLGKETVNLTNALARDNKYQGSFGEMQLRRMLEDMGLERGKQFEEQVTLRDESGATILDRDSESRMQPDVILHFPDKRDIIIDSKTSLTAYLRHKDTSLSDDDRRQALHDHLVSVKNQIRRLAGKGYWRQYTQKGLKLDFVVMFVCSENALQAALSEEPSLWEEAYRQGVLITGPQNLYVLLRILELSWKQMAQVENQQNIIDCANDIVSRVQLFYERFLDAESRLEKTQEAFSKLKTTISPAGTSIVSSANRLLKYGAKEDPKRKKALPQADTADGQEAEADGQAYSV